MAIVNLLPNADIVNSPAWTLSTGSDIWALLDDDDPSNNPSADGSQITATAAGKKCVISFQDSVGDIDPVPSSIDSVQAIIKADIQAKGQSYALGMTIGTEVVGPGAIPNWTEEVISDTASSGWNTHYYTARTTSSSGGSAWTVADCNNLTMAIRADTISGNTLRVTYARFKVTYTPGGVTADNATFFGANF
jgi:hypothetical protein